MIPPLPDFKWSQYNISMEDDSVRAGRLKPLRLTLQILENSLEDFTRRQFVPLRSVYKFQDRWDEWQRRKAKYSRRRSLSNSK